MRRFTRQIRRVPVPITLLFAGVMLPGCEFGADREPLTTVPSAETTARRQTSPPQAEEDVEPAAQPVKNEALPGEDWPNWRGPSHDGISQESGWTSDWPQEGPPQAWETNVGIGFSSVAVVGDSLFTLGHRDGNETVYCLDTADGRPRWTHRYSAKKVDNLHEGGPGSTPSVRDGRVYSISKDGRVVCLSAGDGEPVWEAMLPTLLSTAVPEWGFTSSPVLYKNKLLIEAGRLIALDPSSGDLLWQTKPRPVGYGSPAAFEHDGRDLVASLNNDGLVVADFEDGSELAFYAWPTSYKTNSTTPIYHDGRLFISSGYNKGCALLAIEDGGLRPVWVNRNMRNHFNNSVLWNGALFGIDGNSHNRTQCSLRCVDFQSGELKWRQRGFGCGSVLMAAGQLIILSDEGTLFVADPSTESYREVARSKVTGGKCWTVPVLSHGRLYVRNASGDLTCLLVGE